MARKFVKKINPSSYQAYKASKFLIEELESFLEFVPAGRLSRSLRNLFLEYLPHYVKYAVPEDLENTTADLYFLLEFLDKADKEYQEHERKLYGS